MSYEEFNAAVDAAMASESKWFSAGRRRLRQWLNRYLKIEMTDGRNLVGVFLCTDQSMNVILGNCSEYLRAEDIADDVEPRLLGLAMVPGHHIVTIHVDEFEA